MLLKRKLIYNNICGRILIFYRTKTTSTLRQRRSIACIGCSLYNTGESRGCLLIHFGINVDKLLCGFDIFDKNVGKVNYKYDAKKTNNY